MCANEDQKTFANSWIVIDDDGTTVAVPGPAVFKFCGDAPTMLAMTMGQRKLILLCPTAITTLAPVLTSQMMSAPDGTALDDMRTWGNVLLHEFFHAFGGTNCEFACIKRPHVGILLTPRVVLGDQTGGSPDGEQYLFAGCQNKRQNRVDQTVQNPDSLALFALGK
jgi:hypothetical protein